MEGCHWAARTRPVSFGAFGTNGRTFNAASWQRWLAVGVSLGVAALVVWFSWYGAQFKEFVELARVELRKIVWPNRQETGMTTLVVFAFVVIAGLFFWGLDWALALATRYLTGQGG